MSTPRRQASYFSMHVRSLMQSLGDFARQPIGNLMTVLVIAIAILLPTLFYFVGINVRTLGKRWHDQPQISLYLQAGTDNQEAQALTQSVLQDKLVQNARYISPDDGWKALDSMLHLTTLKEQLGKNPLPGIIRVTPTWPGPSPKQLQELTNNLALSAHVQQAQLDIGWVKRLAYILSIGERLLGGIGALFAIAVLLIIANTIRLTLARHQQEVAILRLLGASKSFIIRPFLYRGTLYGLLGGLLARAALWGLETWLATPIHQLSMTYLSQFQLHSLNPLETAIMVLASGFLGWLGARLATARQLSRAS